MATSTKAVAPAKKKQGFGGIKNAIWIMVICCIIAYCFYFFVLGSPSNFVGNDTSAHPANLMGTVYKGGPVVGLIFTLFLTVVCLGVERYFALRSAFGTMNLAKFTAQVKQLIKAGESRTFTFEIEPFRDLGFVDGDGNRFVDSGEYYIIVKDKKVKISVTE